ncbi:MAG: hypothetical protein ACKV19_27850 [Verrucomicrobiales bacterium]
MGTPLSQAGRVSPAAALHELRVIRGLPCHRFAADTVSIDDPGAFHSLSGITPRQLSDVYLLGLAARLRIAFATFDGDILAARVVGGSAALVVIP